MDDQNWKSRIANGRETAQAAVDTLSTSAREAAATARARIGSTYGQARNRVNELSVDGRDLASTSLEIGSRAAKRSKSAVDKALFQSRDLIAERPLAAVAIGVTAGVVLGFLANRLAKTRVEQADDADDEQFDSY
jgi:ElaB/YqjD/DUF883 family membrane-anchored ribosome-binding protein